MGSGFLNRIDVVTLFPELVRAVTECGITGRAAGNGLLELVTWNPRDFTRDRHRTVDDRPYGGGPGMLMKYEPLRDAIRAARAAAPDGSRVAYLSPQGKRLDQAAVAELTRRPGLILVAGRYEGIDERLIEAEVDEEWSLGDYVLSGGELAAMVIVDCVTRLLPGALGDAASAEQESHVDGLLDCPHYTRPETTEDRTVPGVLLSGDHAAIARWRRKQALGRTWQRRPDMIAATELDAEQRALLEEFIAEQASSA